MAPGADPEFQQAMDKLMLQVNGDNVLDAHTAFQSHADNLRFELQRLRRTTTMGKCGEDPISQETLKKESFAGRIDELFAVHWAHWEELMAVAERLRDSARQYGRTEEEIRRSFPEPPK